MAHAPVRHTLVDSIDPVSDALFSIREVVRDAEGCAAPRLGS